MRAPVTVELAVRPVVALVAAVTPSPIAVALPELFGALAVRTMSLLRLTSTMSEYCLSEKCVSENALKTH